MYRDIDMMSVEELIVEIQMMEAIQKILEGFEELKVLCEDKIAEAGNMEKEIDCPEARPVTFGKLEVCPEASAQRELYAMLHQSIKDENYEEAALLRDIIGEA